MLAILGLEFTGKWTGLAAPVKEQMETLLSGAWTLSDDGKPLLKLLEIFAAYRFFDDDNNILEALPQERFFSINLVLGIRAVTIHFGRFDHFIRFDQNGGVVVAEYPKREGGES